MKNFSSENMFTKVQDERSSFTCKKKNLESVDLSSCLEFSDMLSNLELLSV